MPVCTPSHDDGFILKTATQYQLAQLQHFLHTHRLHTDCSGSLLTRKQKTLFILRNREAKNSNISFLRGFQRLFSILPLAADSTQNARGVNDGRQAIHLQTVKSSLAPDECALYLGNDALTGLFNGAVERILMSESDRTIFSTQRRGQNPGAARVSDMYRSLVPGPGNTSSGGDGR